MKKLRILLIEDDEIEILKFERILSTFTQQHQQITARNGEQALTLLENESDLADLILLDLNMPKMNGLEFLTILKGNKSLHHIPVVILTTSNNQKDVIESYRIGIAGYIMKPLKYEDYQSHIKILIDYWSINQSI